MSTCSTFYKWKRWHFVSKDYRPYYTHQLTWFWVRKGLGRSFLCHKPRSSQPLLKLTTDFVLGAKRSTAHHKRGALDPLINYALNLRLLFLLLLLHGTSALFLLCSKVASSWGLERDHPPSPAALPPAQLLSKVL